MINQNESIIHNTAKGSVDFKMINCRLRLYTIDFINCHGVGNKPLRFLPLEINLLKSDFRWPMRLDYHLEYGAFSSLSTKITLFCVEKIVLLAILINKQTLRINNIIVTGDFNLDMLSNNTSRKVSELCEQFALYQTITEPTHFTENSSYLIDIILTSDKNNLIYSGVAEPFLQQDVGYHCPISGVFKYTKTSKKSFTRRIWSYDRGDYDLLRTKIANTDWDSLSDPDVNTHASNITNHLNSLTAERIPNKTVRIRPSDPPWITTAIRKLIKKRKRAYHKAKQIDTPRLWNTLRKRRNKVI